MHFLFILGLILSWIKFGCFPFSFYFCKRKPEKMKKLGFTLLWTLLLSAAPMLAQDQYDNILYIEDTEALVDSELTLSVKMKNSVDAEGFAFDLILPYGMEVVTDADGNPMASLSEERTTARRTDTFGVAFLTAYRGNRAVRVIAASTNGAAITAGDGEVCTVRIHVPKNYMDGKYRVVLSNISISDTEARSHDVLQMPFIINVRDLSLGDANGDGKVTVADLIAIAHYVMGYPPVSFSVRAADVNQDYKVNVADYVAVVHIINEDPTQSQGGFPRMPPITFEQ